MRASRRRPVGGEAPVDEVIARVHVAGLVHLNRGGVGGQARAVGLEHDLAAPRQHVRERPQQPHRVAHSVQDPETQHDIEALAELAHVQRIPGVPQKMGTRGRF